MRLRRFHPESDFPHRPAEGCTTVRRAVLAAAFLCVAAGGAASDDGPVRFHSVKGWRGTLHASASVDPAAEAVLEAPKQQVLRKGGRWNFDFEAIYQLEFVLDEYESDPSVWRGRVTGSNFTGAYRFYNWLPQDTGTPKGYQESEWKYSANGEMKFQAGDRVELQFHRDRGWSVRLASGRVPAPVHLRHYFSSTGYTVRDQSAGEATGMGGTKTHAYPSRGLVLSAREQKSGSFPLIGSVGLTPAVLWTYGVYLEPTSMEELKLEIEETAEYRKWRPDAQADGGLGTPLAMKARLATAAGGTPKTAVEKFVWELIGTSTVAGIAMNFPVQPQDLDYDLELDATGPMSVVDQGGQRLTRAVRSGFTDSVKVLPRDWGGWAELQVTAHLADGREVRGRLPGRRETGARLPRRAKDSHIADAWKEARVSGPDTLDDENDPVGDGNKGDGFSLYEEYRGFYVDGARVEGDPRAKDFFVYNQIGGDAEPGIELFAALSGLRVHSRLRPTEFQPDVRVMNANNEDSHLVDQHGVVIAAAPSAEALAGRPAAVFGAMTYSVDGYPRDQALRPGSARIIGILPRGHAESLFSTPGNLAASDAASTFDRAIAHELMHTVGVEEHGAGDGSASFTLVAPEDADNSLGRPYFALDGAMGKATELRNEKGHDLAAVFYPAFMAALTRWKDEMRWLYMRPAASPGGLQLTEEQFTRIGCAFLRDAFTLTGQVGAERGEHSGSQDCIMRYHFARFYPFAGRRDAFYFIAPGAERIGFELCRSTAGTGVNAPAWVPQSRHGPAADGGGNCAAQICPNDLVPPRKPAFRAGMK